MATENEKMDVTGLDQAENRKEAEFDLVSALLKAAEYKDDNITTVNLKWNGEPLFPVNIRPISEPDARMARKKATTYMKNPNGKNLPPIEKDFNTSLFNSWIIYLGTTEEDQVKVWGNPAVMQKYGLMQPVESIDILLPLGLKNKLSDKVLDISGMKDDDDEIIDQEEYAKN